MNTTRSSEVNQLLTVVELAAYLQLNVQTIYRWVRRNQIPYRKVGPDKNSAVRFDLCEVMAWTSTEGSSPNPIKFSEVKEHDDSK